MTRSRVWMAIASLGLASCQSAFDPGPPNTTCETNVTVNALIEGSEANLLDVQVLWDGIAIGFQRSDQPLTTMAPSGTRSKVLTGAHTLSLRVVDQVVSPATYVASGTVVAVCPTSGGTQNTTLTPIEPTLNKGESASFRVIINAK